MIGTKKQVSICQGLKGKVDYKGRAQENFGNWEKKVLDLEFCSGHMIQNTCQNSENYILKRVNFTICNFKNSKYI